MKFTNGTWDLMPGITSAEVAQIRTTEISDTEVYLYTVTYPQDYRPLGGAMFELFISSPQPNVIRIRTRHHSGKGNKVPKFDISDSRCRLTVEDTPDTLTITSDKTGLVITKRPLCFAFYYEGRRLTSIGSQYGRITLGQLKTPEGSFMRAQIDTEPDERIYGLGERFTPFVKNGQSVDIWNEDGGTSSHISYKNIPFYLSSRGYGVFVNETGPVSFEICSEKVDRVQCSIPGESIDMMIIGGRDCKNVLENYTNVVGRPALPPAWSFGLWLTSSFLTSYDEKTVMSFVDGMAERDIPLSVFHFDCYWMKENQWCSFVWDDAMFPDHVGMLKRMKDRGLKICVWINPYIAQRSPLFDEAMANGYLLKKPNGDIWQTDLWQSGMGIVDFTNPHAYKWYGDKLRALMADGVDCFKTDFGERIPTDCVYFDGSDPLYTHNYYTYLYNKCVFDVIEEIKGKNEAIVFARSATVGCQRFPVHWGGDCNSNYRSMAESLRGGLSLCLSGFGFWSHDMSGFEGTAPADVYKRWAVFGLLSTHSRLHGADSYRVPWLFSGDGEENGEESVAVLRKFAKLKCRLMPYIFSAAVNTHLTGIPSMRAMVLEFPHEIPCWDLDRQYMLGENLLVAPVFSECGDVTYYLPEGKWTHFLTGETKEGGKWLKENHDFFSLPLLARENSIIPVGENDNIPDYDYTRGLTLHVFSLTDSANATIYDINGNEALTVNAKNDCGNVKLQFSGSASGLSVLMRNIHSVKNVSGAEFTDTDDGILLSVNDGLSDVEFTVC